MNQGLPIRKAVGVIVYCRYAPEHILLIKKIRREDVNKVRMAAYEWDIPKGGVKEGETYHQALLRELKEELGSQNFTSIQRLPFKITFTFPRNMRTKYRGQETRMFFAEYLGIGEDLKPTSSEIGEVIIAPIRKALELIKFKETIEAIKKTHALGFFQ